MFLLLTIWGLEVSLTVDRTNVAVNDFINLNVQVELSGTEDLNMGKIAGLDQFKIEQGPIEKSSRIRVNQNVASRYINYIYVIRASSEGEFTLGPVTINGKESNSIIIKSTKSTMSSSGPSSSSNEDLYLVEAGVSNSKPYQLEQFTYFMRIIFRAPILDMSAENQAIPDFSGVNIISSRTLSKGTKSKRIINGEEWTVLEYELMMLPINSGKLELPKFTIDSVAAINRRSMFGFYDQRALKIDIPAVSLEVLPANSKMVGSFTISANLSKSEVKVGESVLLSIVVEGEGDVSTFEDVNLTVKNYPEVPKLERSLNNGRLFTKKTLSYALVPQEVGSITLGPYSVSFFNPITKTMQEVSSNALVLNVLPGEESNLVVGDQKSDSVEVFNYDILPMKEYSSRNDYISMSVKISLFITWGALPLLSLLMLTISSYLNNVAFRVKKDKQKAISKLKHELHILKDSDYLKISSSIRKCLGIWLDVDGLALTAVDVEYRLKELGVDKKITNELTNLLTNLEMATYGGGRAKLTSKKKILELMQQLFRFLK